MPCRIAHLSDLHLGASPQTQGRLYEGLLEVLRGQALDALFLTGDVFDTHENSPAQVEAFAAWHARLEAVLAGPVQTVVLPGNHDRRGSGVFLPWKRDLFDALRAHFAARDDVHVMGGDLPFLARTLTLPGLPFDLVTYDSTWVPTGWLSAGGAIRQEDLLQVGAQLAQGDPARPVLFLLHHHLVPTPVTDTSRIDAHDENPLKGWLLTQAVDRLLPAVVANADREELTMTALGAGSALTTLQSLGRAMVVLHGHKHYPTARLLKGFDGDGDLLITSAGSCGLSTGAVDELPDAPRLWPSLNFLEVSADRVDVRCQPWSPTHPDRRPTARRLVRARREGVTWIIEQAEHETPQFAPVLELNEARLRLEPSAQPGRLDVVTLRQLRSAPGAWLERYVEILEGAPGAMVRGLDVDGHARPDAACPHRLELHKDGRAAFRVEGAVFQQLPSQQPMPPAFGQVTLLNRSRAALARLTVDLGPVRTTPFASVVNLATGRERPHPLRLDGRVADLTYQRCPARTLLRLSWPLEP